MFKKKVKTLDDLKASDFPGVDPDKFFEWWKEKVILDEEMKMESSDPLGYRSSPFVFLLKSLKNIPQFLKCRRLQKEAGITKEMLQNAYRGGLV